jgi:hypothetical protein
MASTEGFCLDFHLSGSRLIKFYILHFTSYQLRSSIIFFKDSKYKSGVEAWETKIGYRCSQWNALLVWFKVKLAMKFNSFSILWFAFMKSELDNIISSKFYHESDIFRMNL